MAGTGADVGVVSWGYAFLEHHGGMVGAKMRMCQRAPWFSALGLPW